MLSKIILLLSTQLNLNCKKLFQITTEASVTDLVPEAVVVGWYEDTVTIVGRDDGQLAGVYLAAGGRHHLREINIFS